MSMDDMTRDLRGAAYRRPTSRNEFDDAFYSCSECGHEHYVGQYLEYGACNVCTFDGGAMCPNDPRSA